MTRRWWLLALLLVPGVALADPINIVAALAPYIGGTAAAAVATAAVFVSTYGGYIYAAYSVYGGIQARRDAKRAAARARREYNESLQDRLVTTLRADPPWRIVYGRPVVGGDIVAILTSAKTGLRNDGTSYTKPDALKHLVIVLAAHQVQAIHEVMIDGIAVGTLDGSGWATTGEFGGTPREVYQERVVAAGATATFPAAPTVLAAGYNGPGDGGWVDTTYSVAGNVVTNTSTVSATISVRYTVQQGTVRVEKFLGTDGQTASAYLQSVCPSEWTADDRLRGLAGVVITLDLEEPRFQGGPPPLTFDVSGRLLYDPRTSTTAYSENPALVIRDWLTAPFGFNVDADDLDDDSVIAAANACDESISLTVGASTTSSARYTCNGATTTDSAPEAVLDDLARCMAGTATQTGGLWVVNAGVYTVPVLALTEDLKAGPIEVVQAGTGYESLFNGVRGTMIERGRGVQADIDPYSNATYVSADGQELWSDRQFNWTDNRARARNLARIWTEQNREGLVIRYPAMMHAWPLVVGDRVTVTDAEHGWSAKVFRVTDWQWSLDGAVLLTLQEDAESIYDLADAASADSVPNTGLADPFATPAAVAGLSAASGTDHQVQQGDGSIVDRVRVSWTAIASAYVTQGGRIELRWLRLGADTSNAWRTLQAPGDSTQEYLIGARAGDLIVIGATAVSSLGVRGPEALVTHLVAGDTTPPDMVQGFAVAELPGGLVFGWSRAPEADYAATVLQLHEDGDEETPWDDDMVPWYQGDATQRLMPWPADGVYAVLAKHKDHSGNLSVEPVRLLIEIAGQAIVSITRTWVQGTGEGATWMSSILDPENGEILGYVPAAWDGAGGGLLIDTPQLEEEAATEVVSADVPDTVYTFVNSSGVTNLRREYIDTISWTNTTARTVKAELAGEVGGVRDSGPGQAYVHIVQSPTALASGLFPGSVGPQRYLSIDAAYARYTYVDQVVLAPGETVHLGLAAVIQAADGTSTQVTVDGRIRITAILA